MWAFVAVIILVYAMAEKEGLLSPSAPLRPEEVRVDLLGDASSKGVVARGARVDGHDSTFYRAPKSANPDDPYFAGAYDRLMLPTPPGSSQTEQVGLGLDDGLPASWVLPDSAPVLLPEDEAAGPGAETYAERRHDALLASATYSGCAGTSRRVSSAPGEVSGSLSDSVRFRPEPQSLEASLLSGSYDPGRMGPVRIPSTSVPDHEPERF